MAGLAGATEGLRRTHGRRAGMVRGAVAAVTALLLGLGACDKPAGEQGTKEPAPSATPAPTKPVETKPAESKPAETKPAETKPAQATPPESKPAESKPADTQPAETKPAESTPAQTEPPKADPNVKVNKDLQVVDAKIGGQAFKLEVANTFESREVGMMGRTSFPDNTGMIFVFPPAQFGIQRFWMNNCLVDMDLVYLDNVGRILKIHEMKVPPAIKPGQSRVLYEESLPRYSSVFPCGVAIEIPPGSAKKMGLKEGDKVEVDLAGLKKTAK